MLFYSALFLRRVVAQIVQLLMDFVRLQNKNCAVGPIFPQWAYKLRFLVSKSILARLVDFKAMLTLISLSTSSTERLGSKDPSKRY